jgi:hypothetical protein
MLAAQRGVDRLALNASGQPLSDKLAPGRGRGSTAVGQAWRTQRAGKRGVVGQLDCSIEPASLGRDRP